MTWGEIKDWVEGQGIKDSDTIKWIEITYSLSGTEVKPDKEEDGSLWYEIGQ